MAALKKFLLAVSTVAVMAPAYAERDASIPLLPPNTLVGQIQIAAFQPFGQSFTPTLSSVGSISLWVINMNIDSQLVQDKTLTLNLYAGEGFNGPVLGSSTVNVDSRIGTLQGWVGLIEFNVGNVAVQSGQPYSFEVSAASARYGVYWSNEGNYAGGSAILLGTPSATDLYFGVSTVPELASYQLLLLGLASVAGVQFMRRRDRRGLDC